MKKGIHLGPPLAKWSGPAAFALVVLVVLAAALAGLGYRTYRQVTTLRLELRGGGEQREAVPPSTAPASGESARAPALRLRSVLQSGMLAATPPTEALGTVASALPDGVNLASLSLKASPPKRSLLLEALAVDAERVTELQRRMARSPLVAATRLLEERRSAEGRLLVRLQVDLREPSP